MFKGVKNLLYSKGFEYIENEDAFDTFWLGSQNVTAPVQNIYCSYVYECSLQVLPISRGGSTFITHSPAGDSAHNRSRVRRVHRHRPAPQILETVRETGVPVFDILGAVQPELLE